MLFNKSLVALFAVALHISAVMSLAISISGVEPTKDEIAELDSHVKFLVSDAEKHDLFNKGQHGKVAGVQIISGGTAQGSNTQGADVKAVVDPTTFKTAKGAKAKIAVLWKAITDAMKHPMGGHKQEVEQLAKLAEQDPGPTGAKTGPGLKGDQKSHKGTGPNVSPNSQPAKVNPPVGGSHDVANTRRSLRRRSYPARRR